MSLIPLGEWLKAGRQEQGAAGTSTSLPPSLRLSDELLESFDNHPPIILPSGGFKVDLEVETLDDNIYRHLLYIRHFLWSLQSKSSHTGAGPGSAPPKVPHRGGCSCPGWARGSQVPSKRGAKGSLPSPAAWSCGRALLQSCRQD